MPTPTPQPPNIVLYSLFLHNLTTTKPKQKRCVPRENTLACLAKPVHQNHPTLHVPCHIPAHQIDPATAHHIRATDPDYTLHRHLCLAESRATSSLCITLPDAQTTRRSLVCVSDPTLCLAKSGTTLHRFMPLNAQTQHVTGEEEEEEEGRAA
ncbi:hypothetical protein PanWU01x14_207280 [Parasponia andersonii]|uniref:Uncharacterized protein n=1 Tax=Parasponia andersonii TaxID=3476 RepID=A0A2P5BVE9_PARAD|nr:hypothetical protein PanWU01x14_207280 [Parasponia andersonii]